MNRRAFLGLLGGVAAAAVVPLPELSRPITIDTSRAPWPYPSHVPMLSTFKVGDTVTIRLPQRFATTGEVWYDSETRVITSIV